MTASDSFAPLRRLARRVADRSHVPFSGDATGAVLLLDDGAWVPGVRVESASFSLTLPALLNAHTTAVALERGPDVVAIALSRPMRREEAAYVDDLAHGPFHAVADDVWLHARVHDGAASPSAVDGALPAPTDAVSPVLPDDSARPAPTGSSVDGSIGDADHGIQRARRVAERAYVPASDFPVGAVLVLDDGRLVPGVNVEHPDWARILCAERNAVGTVQSYALPRVRRLFLTCLRDAEGSPCGACRQLLAELTPEATLWMDRHDEAPERTTLSALLPGSFRGRALLS